MPKVVDHEQYRKELLQGSLTLFAKRGYGSITMRQIATGLNVSTGTLYHYFSSKEQIFMQLVQELCEQDVSTFFAQAPQEGTIEERLQAVMNFILKKIQTTFISSFYCGLISISKPETGAKKKLTFCGKSGRKPVTR